MTDQCTNCGASVPDWAQLCGCAKTTDDGNVALITGERDEEDIARGGDGIVYASSPEEAQAIRSQLAAQGASLHGYSAPRRSVEFK